jgi:hypothetical protein
MLTLQIVMGIMAWFESLYQGVASNVQPQPQVIYTLVVSVLAAASAVIFFIPFAVSMMHYFWDFIMMVAWFAAFGVLINYYGTPDCNSDQSCQRWQTAEAFSFISAILWGLSMLVVCALFGAETPTNGSRGSHWCIMSARESCSPITPFADLARLSKPRTGTVEAAQLRASSET